VFNGCFIWSRVSISLGKRPLDRALSMRFCRRYSTFFQHGRPRRGEGKPEGGDGGGNGGAQARLIGAEQ